MGSPEFSGGGGEHGEGAGQGGDALTHFLNADLHTDDIRGLADGAEHVIDATHSAEKWREEWPEEGQGAIKPAHVLGTAEGFTLVDLRHVVHGEVVDGVRIVAGEADFDAEALQASRHGLGLDDEHRDENPSNMTGYELVNRLEVVMQGVGEAAVLADVDTDEATDTDDLGDNDVQAMHEIADFFATRDAADDEDFLDALGRELDDRLRAADYEMGTHLSMPDNQLEEPDMADTTDEQTLPGGLLRWQERRLRDGAIGEVVGLIADLHGTPPADRSQLKDTPPEPVTDLPDGMGPVNMACDDRDGRTAPVDPNPPKL